MSTCIARRVLFRRLGATPTKEAVVKAIQSYMDSEVSYARSGRFVDPCPGWYLHLLKLDYPEIFATEEVKAMEVRHAENLKKARRQRWKRLFSSKHNGKSRKEGKKKRANHPRKHHNKRSESIWRKLIGHCSPPISSRTSSPPRIPRGVCRFSLL